MSSYYSKISSEVYDIDKYIGRSFGDVEFYGDRLANCQGKILEPGVGNGRILIPLLEKGLDVEGFDVSKEMLEKCRSNCEKRGIHPKLFEEKMESFSFNSKYDAIIVPTGTFLLVHKREDSIKALKNFYDHLSNSGKLILDIFLPTDITTHHVSTRTWKTKTGEMITLEDKVDEIDLINQFVISHHRYDKWKNGALIQTELERFPLRWYGVEEFKMILQRIGFEDIIISADYKHGQYPICSTQTITFEAVVNSSKYVIVS